MRSSNASRNGHGGFASAARHAKRTFDEGEDDLFALSLDDVMSDRPWTADELMGGGAHTTDDPSETASFIAAAQHHAPEPPVADLDDFATRQFAFDSWAAADLDEASAGVPAFDEPVNPIVAAPASEYAQDINTEAVSASSYTASDDYFADYYTEEEPPHFSEFPQAAKVVFIAIIIALLGVIAFEGFQLFRGPTASESATQQAEDDNQNLDINTIKGDPNDGDDK